MHKISLSSRALEIIHQEGKFPETEEMCLERLLEEVASKRAPKNNLPSQVSFLSPILKVMSDEKPRQLKVIVKETIALLNIPERLLLPKTRKGSASKVVSNIRWAHTWLRRAGLTSPASQRVQGIHAITNEGKKLLKNLPTTLDAEYLYKHYPSFRKWKDNGK